MSYFKEEFEEYTKKVNLLRDKANLHKEKEDYGLALESSLKAVQNYERLLDVIERSESIGLPKGTYPYYEPEMQIPVLNALGSMSLDIVFCYLVKNDIEKASHFIGFLDDINQALERFKGDFSESQKCSYSKTLSDFNLLKATNEIRKASEVKPDLGFTIKDEVSANSIDKENLEFIKAYYDDQFRKTIAAITKIRSLHISSLRDSDEFHASSQSSGSCFIATAAYATENHPDIDTFRKFRDSILLTNTLGKLLVQIYYQAGPHVAAYVGASPILQKFCRYCLSCLAIWMRKTIFIQKW